MIDKRLSVARQENPIVISRKQAEIISEIHIADSEIVKLNDKLISYPCDRIIIKQENFKQIEPSHDNSDPKKPKVHDKMAHIYQLHPPIIINLRDDAKIDHKDTREILTEEELKYFRDKKLPAILFIHGFNVPFGEYSQQIVDLRVDQAQGINNTQGNLNSNNYFLEKSNSLSTILRSQKMLENQFNHAIPLKFIFKDEDLNGTGAHNWFVHMEHNINFAAGTIKNNDYSRYFRLIHISWPGDLTPINYLDAEEVADTAGRRLVKLIKQLNDEKIAIYAIAHSLGNRVLLNTMEVLAQNGHENSLKQVFLWQAAVPHYALTNKIIFDNSIKFNDHFPNAYLSADKITILYSHNDWVLRYQYWLANRIGLTPKEFFNSQDPWQLLYRFMDKSPLELAASVKLAKDDIQHLQGNTSEQIELDLLIRALKECYRVSQTAQAMGYCGVNLKDTFMQKLLNERKLILVDQTFLQGHSAMKIPNKELRDLVYKRWIVNNANGIPLYLP